ncbi:MAG: tail fiber protein [Methanobrevibacter sp.]|nr:tail fiber protein [Methanobrevibacter sp.]
MVYEIKIINGQKVAVPLTADTGSGNPVGTIIAQYKKTNMAGYLYLDGRDTTGTADELETVYPALYAYLGNTNVLPDYREFALVGAEENTTSSNIATHDTYTQGQEKDDQVQNHKHNIGNTSTNDKLTVYNTAQGSGTFIASAVTAGRGTAADYIDVYGVKSGRAGDVTRGKRKAVYFYIKATSGLTESQMDSMITILNQQRSYSTEEIDTGEVWHNGKKIYKKTFVVDTSTYSDTGNWRRFDLYFATQTNIEEVVNVYGTIKWTDSTNSSLIGRLYALFSSFAVAPSTLRMSSQVTLESNALTFTAGYDITSYPLTALKVTATFFYTKSS